MQGERAPVGRVLDYLGKNKPAAATKPVEYKYQPLDYQRIFNRPLGSCR